MVFHSFFGKSRKGKIRKYTFYFLILVHPFFLSVLTQTIEGTAHILTKGSVVTAGWMLSAGLSTQPFCYRDNCVIENSSLEKLQVCVWISTGCRRDENCSWATQRPGLSPRSNQSTWNPWGTQLSWKGSLPVSCSGHLCLIGSVQCPEDPGSGSPHADIRVARCPRPTPCDTNPPPPPQSYC